MEAYLKYTFSRQILVFAIAWMGTRDIYTALIITFIFIILSEYLFHEDSMFCCLPESFKNYHMSLLENTEITEEDIIKARMVLEKVDMQKNNILNDFIDKPNGNQQNFKVLY
jgi:hypothetical protein